MPRHFKKTVCYILLLLSSYTFAAKTTSQITNPDKTIATSQKKPSFTITLAATPSTGFSWLLESYDLNLLTLVKHEYVAPGNPNNKVGITGVENWTFTTKPNVIIGPQVTRITLINARPWDVNNTTHEKATFTIVMLE